MRIPFCMIEMVALIFVLFLSFNAAHTYCSAPEPVAINSPTTQLRAAWGNPSRVVSASDVGFTSPRLAPVEVWHYENPNRSVVVRDDVVVSVARSDV